MRMVVSVRVFLILLTTRVFEAAYCMTGRCTTDCCIRQWLLHAIQGNRNTTISIKTTPNGVNSESPNIIDPKWGLTKPRVFDDNDTCETKNERISQWSGFARIDCSHRYSLAKRLQSVFTSASWRGIFILLSMLVLGDVQLPTGTWGSSRMQLAAKLDTVVASNVNREGFY